LAITTPGALVVVAGAGTGKTRTLVERCLHRVLAERDPVSLERVLMVTFTEAAAAEMRRRIRERLGELAATTPSRSWLIEQLALLDTAQISTLHSFCRRLVRDRFHDLGIDPAVVVLAEGQATLLAQETLDAVLESYYRGEHGEPARLHELVREYGRGRESAIRGWILRLHHYAQTLRDPGAWFGREWGALAQPAPEQWERWLSEGFSDWRAEWLPVLQAQPERSTPAHAAAAVLLQTGSTPTRAQLATTLAAIIETDEKAGWPRGTKTTLRLAVAAFFEDARFLHSVADAQDDLDPLVEDWQWARPQMSLLLQLTQAFGAAFAAAKRELGAVDFHDLEQMTLRLLWNPCSGRPTDLALRWRRRFDLVLVDEYQDINEAQDTILCALGRDGPGGNRFLVGDVKQSIYRFRLANPRIFQAYAEAWSREAEPRRVVWLTENFRSHQGILEFVNRLFAALMRLPVGGVEYDDAQRLRFGATDDRLAQRATAGEPPPVELHLLLNENKPSATAPEGTTGDPAAWSAAEREAYRIGCRLQELHGHGFRVWDPEVRALRPVRWGDMAILLRAPGGKAESWAKAFAALGIPLAVARGGFYESQEILDLLSVLQLLDNPLQDLPLLAVLRSPIVGLSVDELARIRLAHRSGYYWTALRRFHRHEAPVGAAGSTAPPSAAGGTGCAWPKIDRFLGRMRQWRRRAREEALSVCLESILDETAYEAWLGTQPRAAQRRANVQQLLTLTRQFDQFQRQGLFRFLRFVEARQAAGVETEPAPTSGADAVQLMSIHQSKGLEFPVVAAADLGKPFNLDDLRGPVILDERYGLCPEIKPPHTGERYPSLPHWLARRRQHRELLGEELRLLYVASTRARDRLILSGTARPSTLATQWRVDQADPVPVHRLLSAKTCLDWLGAWLPAATGHVDWTQSGACSWLAWHVQPLEPARARAPVSAGDAGLVSVPDEASLRALSDRLGWRYPFVAATREPAKTTVSTLRRRWLEDQADESRLWLASARPASGLTGAEIGTAHHLFLERLGAGPVDEIGFLRQEADRLSQAGMLSDADRATLDLEAVAAFWQSEFGQRVRARTSGVQRELPFTARFNIAELAAWGMLVEAWTGEEDRPTDEFVVVQGVVDLAVILPEALWILDFKTDRLAREELPAKVRHYQPQLWLYAEALRRIYRRPVHELALHFLTLRETVRLEVPVARLGKSWRQEQT
jgi:ATP-dependent helicase/nuclease subunit A